MVRISSARVNNQVGHGAKSRRKSCLVCDSNSHCSSRGGRFTIVRIVHKRCFHLARTAA